MELTFYLFSYNRGPFLRNCFDSIRRNAPGCEIVVVDDDSNDPETLEVLADLSNEARILRHCKKEPGRYGGLYHNLQMAFDEMAADRLFLYIQDDVQMVRPIESDDLEYIEEYFARFPQAAFLNPQFLKRLRRRGIERALSPCPDWPVYFYDYAETWRDRSVPMCYADVCIGHPGRLRRAGWRFRDSEGSTGVDARKLFGKMGLMAHPLLMSLPEVPIYRGKQKTLAVALAERIVGVEPKRFRDMTVEQVRAMKSRPLEVFPYAEAFLTCEGRPPREPFVKENVKAISSLYLLHKCELFAARTLRRA